MASSVVGFRFHIEIYRRFNYVPFHGNGEIRASSTITRYVATCHSRYSGYAAERERKAVLPIALMLVLR